nr:unnamed protein product [Callosobruchus analis]
MYGIAIKGFSAMLFPLVNSRLSTALCWFRLIDMTYRVYLYRRMEMDPEAIKYLLSNSTKPLLLRNMLDWPILQWSLKDWTEALKDEKMPLRCGYFKKSKYPQWESSTEFVHGNIKYFIEHINDRNKWLYFDYKHLQDHLINIKGLKDLWLLFPPDENLYPTRIPYEESSVFSKLNFFSPSIEDFKNVSNCRKVILNPGDVLFVPHRWWHYVENLETAISINTWVPMDEDNRERLEESIVQFLVKLFIDSDAADDTTRKVILNPNVEDELGHRLASTSLNILEEIKKRCSETRQMSQIPNALDTVKNAMTTNDENLQNVTNPLNIPILSNKEFSNFLLAQIDRFSESGAIKEPVVCNSSLIETMEAILHPEVITLIREKILTKQEMI